MDILFQQGECSAHDVRDRLPEPPSYSAVRALLAKLVDKGLLKIRAEVNRYLYSPTEDQVAAGQSAMQHLVSTFYDDSPVKAANALLGMHTRDLSESEIRGLRELIDQLEEEGA
jgi:predicted transcriptional regulator